MEHDERRLWWTIAAVGLAVFIAIMLLGRPLVMGRLEAARNLDRAASLIESVDDDLVVIDTAVRDARKTGWSDSRAPALSAVNELRPTLEEAARLSQTGYDRLTTDEQKRASAVKGMAIARLELLAVVESLLRDESVARPRGDSPSPAEYERAAENVRKADAALGKL